MQSLDTGFFGPLKKAYATACDNWQVSHPGQAITQFQVVQLFGTAYLNVAKMERAKKAFESCGIWPFNDQVFTDEDFSPSEVTDHPFPLTESRENEQTSTQAESQMPSVVTETVGTGDSLDLAAQPSNCHLAETANKCCVGSLALGLSAQPSHCDLAEASKEGCDSSALLSQSKDAAPINEPIRDITNKSTASPSTFFIKPSDIRLLPKANIQKKRNIKQKKSEILTSAQVRVRTKKKRPQTAKTTKTKNNNQNRPILAQTGTGREVIRCPLCMEVYTEPPDEDWIQCGRCEAWWHDECTDYLGFGNFKCDNCL
ncbi:unnamed protein product [Parnassius apollo]|uniref:(apollo) hypothetical protein n=1 Tax=Parnassius apollo TaxID=110799 RepID=A0A8S3WAF6_PARAO|nr:unnamed protein product [Parnassius apollo]